MDDFRDFNPDDPDDRLAHLVSLLFDSFALTADYGGVAPCPYDEDEVDDDEFECEEVEGASISDSGSRSSSCSGGLSGEETTVDLCQAGAEISDGTKPQTLRIRTSLGLVDVDMEPAGKPTALSALASDAPRVLFTNGLIEVRESSLGGFGVFATKDLECKQHILVERALFHANYTSAWVAFESLCAADKELFLDLHGHAPENDSLQARVQATYFTNDFVCGGRGGGGGVFLAAARFNHACSARCSVKYAYDLTEDVMTFTVGRADGVRAGEELTVCYGKDRDMLREQYGFDCECGACDSVLREANEERFI